MQRKLLILAVLALVLIGGTVFVWQKKRTSETTQNQNIVQEENAPISGNNEAFVTDVDPDVSHWQTKETEYIMFKFPKEWYWVELSGEKSGSYGVHAISNNLNFRLVDNREIGIFSDIGPTPPITLRNSSEIVITERGVPTSNAGSPSDSLSAIFELAKYNYPAVKCVQLADLTTLPLIAYCSATYPGNQQQLSYYVIDGKWSLTLTVRTFGDAVAFKDILEKMARNIKIKY